MYRVSPSKAAGNTAESKTIYPPGLFLPFALVTALFFLWGIPNNLNDVLIRQFMKSFALSRFRAGLVQSAFYLGYFTFAIPAALAMRRYGYKFGFICGLCLLGTGTTLFWPAAHVDSYVFFLCALFVIASGLSFLETAGNPFIAQLGGPEGAARRLNFSQAFNPLGAIAGVLVGTIFIFSGIELTPQQVAFLQAKHSYLAYMQHETERVVAPYIVLGFAAFLLAAVIYRTKFPDIANAENEVHADHGRFLDLLGYPHFLLAVLAQFLYVGAQVCTWSYFIQYVEEYTRQPEKTAGYFLTGTLVAFGIGRFVSAEWMKFIQPARLMGIYGVINILLVAVGVVFPGWFGLWAIFLTSFFMSAMYPTIFALGIDKLERNTKIGGSLIVMSIVGGAVLTPIMGLVSEARNLSLAYLVPLACYCVVTVYAFWWSRIPPKAHFARTAKHIPSAQADS